MHVVAAEVLFAPLMHDLVALGEGRVDFLEGFRASVHGWRQFIELIATEPFQSSRNVLEQV